MEQSSVSRDNVGPRPGTNVCSCSWFRCYIAIVFFCFLGLSIPFGLKGWFDMVSPFKRPANTSAPPKTTTTAPPTATTGTCTTAPEDVPVTSTVTPTTTLKDEIDAAFLRWCKGKPSDGPVHHFCWPASNILVAYYFDKTLLRFDVNIDNKTCKTSVIDTGVRISSLTCTKEGKIYGGFHSFNVYNIHKPGVKEPWYSDIMKNPGTLAENENYIVVSDNKHSVGVHDKNRKFLYWRNFYAYQTVDILGITEDDELLLYFEKEKVYVYDLHKNMGMKLDDWHYKKMACLAPDNKIMAVEYWDGHLLVYSHNGRFLYQLNWDLDGKQEVEKIAVTTWKDKPTLMALNTKDEPGTLRFYSLKEGLHKRVDPT